MSRLATWTAEAATLTAAALTLTAWLCLGRAILETAP